MSRGVRVRVWGDWALFSRPEMKVERCSYDVITPSAARGILEAVYWHPGMKWVIDKIYVRKPIQFTSIRRNEVKSKILASSVLNVMNDMTDHASDCDNPGKFKDIIMRRLRRGECYHTPYFGCREFPAKFELYESDDVTTEYKGMERELGYMFYDFDYSNPEDIQPLFFRAVLKDGVLDVWDQEVVR